ncbi:MAG: mycofactocin system transcriptional regulator [Williamsia herbipolensis]|uniref:Transcriptional regulator, TetR family n=1 Tax=Williamsia serinedens TaxID=391736 RepID=A0ABT1H380_9NOCA|nr:mycofactocin system transcriptional regulator [Williamsia serinedens]MBE7161358.1 mycofactocin system transcriptional regulator [Williamsia herbipolensis]MCP2161424.1 transcriptional regulator, TetR family [Williamsia serinedens]
MTTPGRRPSTTRARISAIAIDLFTEQGFDETSVDDIAAAAGIARRTLFRYYPSKNAIAWGEFDTHLEGMRRHLADIPPSVGLAESLRSSLVAFNRLDPSEVPAHRRRMALLLTVPALQAHSMLMYAGWREVVADHVAAVTGERPRDHRPQTVAWLLLGIALAAYEQWLADDRADLDRLLTEGSRILDRGL